MSAASCPMLGQMTGGSSGEQHLDWKPGDNSEAACQLATRQISHEIGRSPEFLFYPEGEGDAVPIGKEVMAQLQPGKFLGNDTVDFYIRYLERGLSREHENRFHFFNSFFFPKLLECKGDYEQLRNWTAGVDLFTKDYVFIPIVESSHWSLIIICHLSSLTRPSGETGISPCVYHLDPMEGQHKSFEALILRYAFQAWIGRDQASRNLDQRRALSQMKYVQAKVPQQDNSHDCGLYVLNYIEAFLVESSSSDFSFTSSEKGPDFFHPHSLPEVLDKRRHIQNLIYELRNKSEGRAGKRKAIDEVLQSDQNLWSLLCDEGNSKACISGSLSPELQHVELEHEVQIVGGTNFNGPLLEAKHLPTHEDAMDVQHEQSCGISWMDYDVSNGLEHQHVQHSRVSEPEIIVDQMEQTNPKEIPCMDLSNVVKGENKRRKIMTKDETWVLLSCKLKGDPFCKGNRGDTNWNLIREEIGKELGSWPSAYQCRLRYDTLLKAYKTYKKYFMEIGKTFCEITEEKRVALKLATTMSEEWFLAMDKICNKANICEKIVESSSNACNGLHPLNSLEFRATNAPQISRGGSQNGVVVLDNACGIVGLRNVIAASTLSSLNEDLQSTLLNLVQECSFSWIKTVKNKREFDLEEACRGLAILQDREPRDILSYVLRLWQLKLVHVKGMVFEEAMDLGHPDFWKGKSGSLELTLYEKIVEEVVCKNLKFQTHWSSFPFEKSSLQHIKVLKLSGCSELEHLDLREFPSLQCLSLHFCVRLNLVTGWEVATGIGLLEIAGCDAYHFIPKVQYLLSLRDFEIYAWDLNESMVPWQLSEMRQCAKLQRLQIGCLGLQIGCLGSLELANVEILRELKSLESLTITDCSFSSILDVNGFKALTSLSLKGCKSFKRVLGLGSLKGLTHLDMSWSDVEDVEGVGELELLTWLSFQGCKSLKQLPCLGQLRILAYLNLHRTSVKEIPGKEGLISLKTLL